MADTLDIVTLAEGQAAINDTTPTTELASYITAVSRRIDDLCGPVVKRLVTESHDGGAYTLYLRKYPVLSVATASVTDYTTARIYAAESNTAKTAYDYLLDGATGTLRSRSSGSDRRFVSGRRNVVVTYYAGRYEDTASVDEKFKNAARQFLRHVWVPSQGGGSVTFPGGEEGGRTFPTFGVPNVVLDMLEREIQGPESR